MNKLKKLFSDYDDQAKNYPVIVSQVKARFKKGLGILLILSVIFAVLFPYLTNQPFSFSCIIFALAVIAFSPIMFRRAVLDEIKRSNI